MAKQKSRANWGLKDYLLSWTLIGTSVTLGNPLDLVRFRFQVMPELLEQGQLKVPYKGFWDCVRRVRLEEGWKGFMKGNLSNLIRILPSQTCIFQIKEYLQCKFHYHQHLTPSKHFLANTLIGITASFIVSFSLYPLEYARQLLSNRVRTSGLGLWHHLRDTIKIRGITGLYQGVHIFLFGHIIFRGTYFGIFDSLKVKTDSERARWFYSYFSMFIAILLAYPSDSIRRRIVSSGNKYPGMLRGLSQVWRKEGIKGVFLGWQMIFLQSLTGCTFFYFYDKLFTDYSMARE